MDDFTLTLYFNVGGITITSYTKKHKDIRHVHVPSNSPVNSAITEPVRNKAGFELLAIGNQKFQVEDGSKQQVSRFLTLPSTIKGSQNKGHKARYGSVTGGSWLATAPGSLRKRVQRWSERLGTAPCPTTEILPPSTGPLLP